MASSEQLALVAVTKVLLGPILAGLYLNLMLYGVSVTQFYLYYSSYAKRDKKWMTYFIALLFVADTANSVFNMVYVYGALINNFGDQTSVTRSNWVFAMDPMMTALIGGMVQGFFAWRVRVLTGSILACIVTAVLAVVECLGGLGTGAAVLYVPEFQKFQSFKPITVIWLVGSAAADILITVVLVWYLRRQKSGYSWTDDVVDRIIRLTVQTGMVTAIVACIDCVLYLASPDAYHLTFNFMLAKLYTNSLLSSLNARRGWAFTSGSQPSGSRDQRRAAETISLGHLQSKNARPQVFVSVESHQITDNEGSYETKVAVEDGVPYPTEFAPPPPGQYRPDRKDSSGQAM
ncbi:hypothetical protein K488DRAFT_87392 [Vararia minispora EC-137]|uniref:Uncharacterized protein n=1 Tax=Vararia minispora EC-137 TaxID=1314806 RepID=A0ACB8QG88_9AGAM|nr:hypothetical protein K488DRAFT_87392 [Vararia minispora EC-137]